MERDQIDKLLKAKPFQPFTVHTDDGDLIGVKSPEYIWLPPTGSTVFIAADIGDGGATKLVSLEHISQVTVGPGTNVSFPSSDR
ncbi:MAG TPA: hypothetical protein VF595_13895 [Tepidisphaeraceae bacterium]|jgi:hypothetical protein